MAKNRQAELFVFEAKDASDPLKYSLLIEHQGKDFSNGITVYAGLSRNEDELNFVWISETDTKALYEALGKYLGK